MENSLINPGIIITSITAPESGWPIACYCPICKETTFVLSPWAEKPKDGDYWRINEMCASEEFGNRHNIEFAIPEPKIKFEPIVSVPPIYPSSMSYMFYLPIEEAKRRYPNDFPKDNK